jgi:hypothetical protein
MRSQPAHISRDQRVDEQAGRSPRPRKRPALRALFACRLTRRSPYQLRDWRFDWRNGTIVFVLPKRKPHENGVIVKVENGEGWPNQYHGLFFLESDRDPDWRFRVGALAAVVVVDECGAGLEAYLNPRCETLRLDPSVFDGPNDRVLGPSDDGAAYGLLSGSGSRGW